MDKAQMEKLSSILTSLAPLVAGLKKYEANFSPDAKQLLQKTLQLTESATSLTAGYSDAPGLMGYLLSGAKSESLLPTLTTLQQSLSTMLSGSMPLPRSSKEELTNLRYSLATMKLEGSTDNKLVAARLSKLYANATDNKHDVDAIEAQVDDVIRSALQNLYGVSALAEQDLQTELETLEGGVNETQGTPDGAMLSLALNSLQRLHAAQLKTEESEEDVVEDLDDDDDEDPFFMPMMPAAVKLADEGKFKMLAQPLGPEQPKQFLIQMDTDEPRPQMLHSKTSEPGSSGTAVPTMSTSALDDNPGLTEKDFEPVPMGVAQQASPSAAVQPPDAPQQEQQQQLLHQASSRHSAQAESAAHALQQASISDAQAPVDTSNQLSTTGPGAPPVNEDKLRQFVNFLQGENPGACMFHAQMRLSIEGCRKLSSFLKSSARVRALSLSHNYLGDDGIKIICEGLRVNTSITAMDLPDNNISDAGAVALAGAISHNPSLTQLQLAFNKIGDQGAAALAEVIKKSQSLKKLGLSNNNIGKAGCQALTAAINSNQSLKHLQLLPGNPVEEKDAKALAKALKRNKKFSIRSLLGME